MFKRYQGPPLIPTSTGRNLSVPNLCIDVSWTDKKNQLDQRLSLTAVAAHGQILVSATDEAGVSHAKTLLAEDVIKALRPLVLEAQ